jgi:hypothetical protein
MQMHLKKCPYKIHFIYLDNKKIYFIIVSFFVQQHPFTNHMEKFKYQPRHSQVKQKSHYVYTFSLLCQISTAFLTYMKATEVCC